jgi:hypothetical protein
MITADRATANLLVWIESLTLKKRINILIKAGKSTANS